MKKLSPKKRIYLTTPVFELEVSYSYKGQNFKTSYVFDNTADLKLFADEAINMALGKGFQNINIAMFRKDRYYDSKIDQKDVKDTVQKSSKGRQQRIEENLSF